MRKICFFCVSLFLFTSSFTAADDTGKIITSGYNSFATSSDTCGAIYYSTNGGSTWNISWDTDENEFYVKRVVYITDLNQFFALGSYDKGYYTGAGSFLLFKSGKGMDWDIIRPDLNTDFVKNAPTDIAYGNGMLVAVGGTCIIYSTDEGENWHSIVEQETGDYAKEKITCWESKVPGDFLKTKYHAVAFVNGNFLLTGTSHRALFLKPQNGKLQFVSDKENNSQYPARTIAYNGGNIITILGSKNDDFYSEDGGQTWHKIRGITNYNISSVVYAKGLFVAACDESKIIYSANGKTWNEAGIKPSGYKYVWDVVYSNRDNKFYAVKSYSGSSELLISDDGMEWQGINAGLADDNGIEINFMSIAVE